jgi:hypothetical protein
MTRSLPRIASGGGALFTAVFGVVAAAGWQARPQPEPAQKAAPPTRLYFGITACAQCHTKPGESEPVLCRCTEAAIWGTEDKHRDAFQVLHGDRAKQIGELMQLPGPVWEQKRCVSCHGVWIDDVKLRHRTFKQEDGVSCVACHGAFKEWVQLHGDVLERDNWRGHSRTLKEEKYGMRDLWDPIKRVRLCSSCHAGNTAEGKVVTHVMYAAGHPPLPSLEVATFSDAMPRHWQYGREKKPEIQKLLQFEPGETAFEQTRLAAVGGVAVLRESLDLLATQASLTAADSDTNVVWPELALFDCAACHHELEKPAWKQKRGFVGEPGQPPLPRWPTELATTVLDQLGGEEGTQFRDRLKAIEKAAQMRPFGNPGDIALAAWQTADWLDQHLPRLTAKKYDRTAALQLLRRLAANPGDRVFDYDSARQRVWAIRILYQELSTAAPKPANDPAVRQLLDALDKELGLSLPAGRKQSIEEHLKGGLKKRSDYGADHLKQALAELTRLLPDK